MKTTFETAEEAFEYLYNEINSKGIEYSNTKALFNVGFYILKPEETSINTLFRKWNPNYAAREWAWYMSADPSAVEISKYAPIWKNMMDPNGEVRSNYGWQWKRNNQLTKVISKLALNNEIK